MSYVLLKFSSNWADEMDVEGFLVTSRAYFNAAIERLKALDSNLHICVGTNEHIEWDNVDALLSEIEVVDLTEADAHALSRLFPLVHYWADDDGWQEHVIAGMGETGFLDNVAEGSAF